MKEAIEIRVAISFDSESGDLHIDEEKFALHEKPQTVRKLLLTYKECKEFVEHFTEVVEEISEMQESSGSLAQFLGCQSESRIDLYDIKELYKMWQKCSSLIIEVPKIEELFAKF